MHSRVGILGLTVLAVNVMACGEDSGPPANTFLQTVQAPPPAGVPADFLIDTLRIRLVDDDDTPQPGEQITWVVTKGGGTIIPVENVTDGFGLAGARWLLGPGIGLNEVQARSPLDSTVTFQTHAEVFRVDRLDSNYGLGCGLRSGDLWCWGQNAVGNDPVSTGPAPYQNMYRAPGLVAAGRGFTQVAVGWISACALDAGGAVQCYRTGNNTEVPALALPPMRSIAGTNSFAFCGLAVADSTAWCWDIAAATAAQVPSSPAFLDLEIDAPVGTPYTACGRLVDSTAACWGRGPLGDGTFNSSASAVPVAGGLRVAELAVGEEFACGVLPVGEVWCWGRNYDGQLGNSGPDAAAPILITSGVSKIAAALRTVIAIQNGSVVRWGFFGANGGGNPPTMLSSVSGLPVSDFAANDISCLLLVDGQVYCFDELWLHTSTVDIDRYTPVQPAISP